jgi:Family of unknown function (DUF5947)
LIPEHPTSKTPKGRNPFAALRRLARPQPPVEQCELCAALLAPEHPHLLDLTTRQLLCSCGACAILFSGQAGHYRRIPQRIQRLTDFRLSDVQWEGLSIPIGLAFFYLRTPPGKVVALYPSPAGATESLLPLEAWEELAAENPVLHDLEPDVEALLVNRIGQGRDCYRVPIDECYRLVGLIRTNWQGLSGGPEVWAAVTQFFGSLQERSDRGAG